MYPNTHTFAQLSAPTGAQYEIHCFVGTVNPSEEEKSKYVDLVSRWNATFGTEYRTQFGNFEMKAPILTLVFRKPGHVQNPVTVLQSATYCKSNDFELVKAQAHQMADYFAQNGLPTYRVKIEASAHGISGVPQTDDEASKYTAYFEFHVKCQLHNAETIGDTYPLTPTELAQFTSAASVLSRKMQVPVPESFNVGRQGQRFLNLRTRGKGMNSNKTLLTSLKDHINTDTPFRVVKVIEEYVVYDTAVAVDKGWIDFDSNETMDDLF